MNKFRAEKNADLPPAHAVALSIALAVLPCVLLVQWADADRFVPLLFLPALWLSWRAPRDPRGRDLSDYLFWWLLGGMVLAAMLADHTARAFVMSAAVGCALTGACVARGLGGSLPAVRTILWGLLIGSAIGGVLVWLGCGAERMFFPTYWSARLFGGHLFSGAMAGLALLVIPRSDGLIRAGIALPTLVCWTGLAWSGSRAPALGMAMMLALWFWRGGRSVRSGLWRWVPALGLIALIGSRQLGNPYPQLGWWSAMERTSRSTTVEAVTSERTAYWEATWEQVKDAPWLGNGADAYLFLQPKQPGNQPHNTFLQWLLEYGVLGGLPWLLLCLLALRWLRGKPEADETEVRGLRRWAAAATGGFATYALFDGVGYHMVLFMPAAVIAGLALSGSTSPSPSARVACPPWSVRVLSLTALALLLLHGWLVLMLMRGHNVTPDSPPARILWYFPSATEGLTNWTETWRKTRPDIADRWIAWAQRESVNPGSFHVHAAQLHIRDRNWAAAERELIACLTKVNIAERADVQIAIDTVRKYAAEQAANSAPPRKQPIDS